MRATGPVGQKTMSEDFDPRDILLYIGHGSDNAIGENLIKVPFMRAVREAFPCARVSWVHGSGESQFQSILKPLSGDLIDEILPDDTLEVSLGGILGWPALSQRRRFDLVIDTQKRPQKTVRLRRLANTCFISATWNYWFSDRRPPAGFFHSMRLTERLFALVAAAAGRILTPPSHVIGLPDDIVSAAAKLLPDGPTYIGLAPGAGRQDTGKMWPYKEYLAVALAQVAKGRTPVFIVGPSEQRWVSDIRENVPEAVIPDLTGNEIEGITAGPPLTVALGRRLAAAVSNCSGAGHLLAAGGVPMVSLYGPTDPRKFLPYTPHITAITAQQFGGETISKIPRDAVLDAIEIRLSAGRV